MEEAGKKDYRGTLDYLFGLQRFGIKLGLANITGLLDHLGNPHREFRAVHIAGSNGKGSTAAFLASILRQAGCRVGLYTSPHLVDFRERIQIDGLPISTDRVVSLTEQIRSKAVLMDEQEELWPPLSSPDLPKGFDREKATITFFEFTTVMAFLYFREEKVEWAVLETGMGGRLDATNVIDPLLSVITSISLEHQQHLGKTLTRIAEEKAGIIKARRPLITAVTQPRIRSLLQKRCRELQSPFYALGQDFAAKPVGSQKMHYRGRGHEWPNLRLGLLGRHQIINASMALAAAEVLMEAGVPIEEETVRRGLAEVYWPGRLELIPGPPRIVLDGAHNAESSGILKKAMGENFPRRRLILILGIMADKAISKIMAHLAPLADTLILTRPGMDRAASLEVLRAEAAPFRKPTQEIPAVGQALDRALKEAEDQDVILVTGSLFTVGEARAYFIQKGLIADR
jgi:dihydrofolate synthase / folylpolyglutamate synthase